MKLGIFLYLFALPMCAAAERSMQGPSGSGLAAIADAHSMQANAKSSGQILVKSRSDRLQLAAAEEVNVSALPATMSTPGTYVLSQDLVLDSSSFHQAISIRSSDVILDCQGKRISVSVPDGGLEGVFIASSLSEVTVMNCVLEGFDYGVRGGSGGTGLKILNNELHDGGNIGIYVSGNDTHVVGNRIIAQHYTDDSSTSGIGIMLSSFDGTSSMPSSGALIQDNFIVGLKGREQAMGIQIVGSTGAQVLGNKILDISADDQGAYVYAIFLRASYRWPKPPGVDVLTSGTIIRSNELMLRQHPLNTFAYATDGIALDPIECVGNLSIGFAKSAFSRCVTASNNIESGTLYPMLINGSQPRVQ